VPGLSVDLATVQTNIVNVEVTAASADAEAVVARLAARDVLALVRGPRQVRAVTHRLVGDADVARAAAAAAGAASDAGGARLRQGSDV